MSSKAVKHRFRGSADVEALSDIKDFGKVVVVHLGNNQIDREAQPGPEKTAAYARRFRDFEFIGIDITPLKGKPALPGNFRQIPSDFLGGLGSLADGSVDIISSELALGHYTHPSITHLDGSWGSPKDLPAEIQKPGGYTKETVKAAYRKLKPGGKLMVVVDEIVLAAMAEALEESPFGKDYSVAELAAKEAQRTYYLRDFAGKGHTLYQIIAKKQTGK